MTSSELLKLTNRELKNILRENNINNYSKLNKVNKILNSQQKGGQNHNKKKYKLKELIGGYAIGIDPPPESPPQKLNNKSGSTLSQTNNSSIGCSAKCSIL